MPPVASFADPQAGCDYKSRAVGYIEVKNLAPSASRKARLVVYLAGKSDSYVLLPFGPACECSGFSLAGGADGALFCCSVESLQEYTGTIC